MRLTVGMLFVAVAGFVAGWYGRGPAEDWITLQGEYGGPAITAYVARADGNDLFCVDWESGSGRHECFYDEAAGWSQMSDAP